MALALSSRRWSLPEIISRDDARNAGLKRFYAGVPCIRGHYSERLVSVGSCGSCMRELLAWRRKNPGVQRPDVAPKVANRPGVVSRAEAKAAGLGQYYTGFPCQ